MKRIALAMGALLYLCAAAAAESPAATAAKSPPAPFTAEAATGAYYDAYPLTGSILDIFLVLFMYTRAGGTVDFEYNLGGGFGAGAETGIMYMTYPADNPSVHVVDLPLRAKVSFSAGFFTAEIFAGSFLAASASDLGFFLAPYYDAGVRLGLWKVFLEASFELPFNGDFGSGLPRFGAGALIPLIK